MDNTVRLEASESGNPDYIDFRGDIVGNMERGICFVLTYVVTANAFYATISDTGGSAYEEDIKDIPHEVAEFLIGSEEYNKLKDIHRDYLTANPRETGGNTAQEFKMAFWEVIRLARGGQQPWWSESLKEKSDEVMGIVENYYKEKYDH